jgi:hypothetical protein
MIRKLLRIAGFVIFVLAFFLPAVTPGPGAGSQLGWVCAVFSLMSTGAAVQHPATLVSGGEATWKFALVFSGWVNPLLLIYLLLCIWSRLVSYRRTLAIGILFCLCSTWFFLTKQHFTPLIGHCLWVAGIVLMLLPELIPVRPLSDKPLLVSAASEIPRG